MTKLPPIEKIHEALGAIADGRVHMSENQASVTSSNGAKTYTVRWDGDEYSSNDNATYWRLYPGYPIIAVLMLQGRLPLNRESAARFSGINWTELNEKHKRDYARAVAGVMEKIKADNGDIQRIAGEIDATYKALGKLDITVRRGSLRPPK